MNNKTSEKNRLRILMFSPHYAEYSLRLAIAHAEHSTVKLMCRDINYSNEVDDSISVPPTLKITLLPGKNTLLRLLSIPVACIISLIFRPDVVHVQEQPSIDSHLVARFLIWLWPTVLTVHDPAPHSGLDKLRFASLEKKCNKIRSVVNAFHVHGEQCVRALTNQTAIRGRIIVNSAHGPILIPMHSELADPVPDRMLLFGRMQKYKGVDQFVTLLEHLKQKFPTIRGVLAGRGPELQRLKGRIEFAGNIDVIDRYLSPSEARAEFQKTSLIVLPYTDATQSGVVAAAFANGRPVLATRVGGLADSVIDGVNGFLVPPGDSCELEQRASEFFQNDQLRKHVTLGAQDTGNVKISWTKISAQLRECYLDLTNIK